MLSLWWKINFNKFSIYISVAKTWDRSCSLECVQRVVSCSFWVHEKVNSEILIDNESIFSNAFFVATSLVYCKMLGKRNGAVNDPFQMFWIAVSIFFSSSLSPSDFAMQHNDSMQSSRSGLIQNAFLKRRKKTVDRISRCYWNEKSRERKRRRWKYSTQ